MPTPILSALQTDALCEIFNLGVGRAAAALSQIVGNEVQLSVPEVALVMPEAVRHMLVASQLSRLSTVSQHFSGPFEADALLIFPETNALTIVSHMLDGQVAADELSEYEQEAMCEVGNIIHNACISAMADQFQIELHGGLPEHHFCDVHNLGWFNGIAGGRSCILLLQIDLNIQQDNIHGHILYLLGSASLESIIAAVDHFLGELEGIA